MARRRAREGGGREEKIVFPFMRAASERSRRAWEDRWSRGEKVGPKGAKFLEERYEYYDIEAPLFEDWEFEIDY